MKKLIIIVTVILVVFGFINEIRQGQAASANIWYNQLVTSTGTTAVACTRNATEVYIVNFTTTASYVTFNSTTPTPAAYDAKLQRQAVTAPPDVIREDGTIWKFAVRQDTAPVNMLLRYKCWR